MTTNLENIKVGDMLAVREKGNSWREYAPTHKILIVDRITATQVCCSNEQGGSGEWRFRKSDGKQIGESCSYAEIPTQELLDKVQATTKLQARNQAARLQLMDLAGKELHQLKLTLEQTEALAVAWTAVKAMKPAA